MDGISRISQPGMKAVNFAKAIAGQRLNGSVIKEIEVGSEGSCRLKCVEEERCRSYNFGTTKDNSEKFKCELSESDRFVGFINFTKEENFNYRGIQVILINICLEPLIFKSTRNFSLFIFFKLKLFASTYIGRFAPVSPFINIESIRLFYARSTVRKFNHKSYYSKIAKYSIHLLTNFAKNFGTVFDSNF